MEKKIEVITKEGRIVRVMPHMIADMALFEATKAKKDTKPVPKELIKPVSKEVSPLPKMVITWDGPIKEVIPMKTITPEETPEETSEVPKRKSPVRSRSKK